MEKIDIVLWVMSGGFGLMLVMGHGLNSRMDKIDNRMDRLENRMQRIENDMIEVKTILRLKEYCMIKDDRQIKKVE